MIWWPAHQSILEFVPSRLLTHFSSARIRDHIVPTPSKSLVHPGGEPWNVPSLPPSRQLSSVWPQLSVAWLLSGPPQTLHTRLLPRPTPIGACSTRSSTKTSRSSRL